MKKNIFERAFTLLEMLIVISIIGILVGMGTVSYSTAQKKTRDAKRKIDLKAVQNCMEQYYAVNTAYKVITGTSSLNCGDSNTLSVTDPLNSGTYIYIVSASTASTYTITATLEGGGSVTISNLQ